MLLLKKNNFKLLLLLLPLQEKELEPLYLKAWKMNPNGLVDSLIDSLSLKLTSTIILIILTLDLITSKGEWTMWSMIFINFKLSTTYLALGLLLCLPLKEMITIVLISFLYCYLSISFLLFLILLVGISLSLS